MSQPRHGTEFLEGPSKPRLKPFDTFGASNGAGALPGVERVMTPPARQDLGLVHGRSNLRNMAMI
ncbi:hypothetical protein A1O1_08542 [Capronia coronata CBS 617.96]|uniref:Uncharacterized protein n=1 Tax=Capronia coronata CBS 617.96 TaxID=1182541 RepID=W9XJP6_9EURO|nr:uncharacterized protein A1O1_08542 [Capronia coronata CBS 617.96]EXJ80398.1 hypothetical protein A1O1_08542 [Capronia coronata CBS 617.96]